MLRMADSPGKFEGETLLAKALYEFSLHGGADEEVHYGEGEGYCGLFNGPFKAEEFEKVLGPLTEEEKEFLSRQVGAILYETSTGFVSVEWYDRESELLEAWSSILEDVAYAEDPFWDVT